MGDSIEVEVSDDKILITAGCRHEAYARLLDHEEVANLRDFLNLFIESRPARAISS